MTARTFFPALLTVLMVITGLPLSRGHAATITIVPGDGAGEGFYDTRPPDPASTAGGNAGATLGEQRYNAFAHAASIWSSALVSPVEIRISAVMDPLPCTSRSAVLGAAGPQSVHADFAGTPNPQTWYPQALANSLAGVDLSPEDDDIMAVFNSSIGTTCPFPYPWYYGLDAKPPKNTVDFVAIVLHELTHGLGFITLVDTDSGTKFAGLDDAFMQHLEDHSTGLLYPLMTDAERAAANRNTGNLHWVGASVVAMGGLLQDGRDPGGHVEMYAPNPPEPGSSVSHFSNELAPDELMEWRYTGSNHAPGLAASLFADIGWELNPVPSIRGNGVNSALTVGSGALLNVAVSLESGGQDGQPADWWAAALTPEGWYWFTLDSGWIRSDEAISGYSGPLFKLASYTLFNGDLAPGQYTVYFGVDLIPNGVLDFDSLYYTPIAINIQ